MNPKNHNLILALTGVVILVISIIPNFPGGYAAIFWLLGVGLISFSWISRKYESSKLTKKLVLTALLTPVLTFILWFIIFGFSSGWTFKL